MVAQILRHPGLELMTPPDPPKRPIGFISPKDKGKKTSSQARSKT